MQPVLHPEFPRFRNVLIDFLSSANRFPFAEMSGKPGTAIIPSFCLQFSLFPFLSTTTTSFHLLSISCSTCRIVDTRLAA
jgi:hypothetical protein